MTEEKDIYLVWDVYGCKYIGAILSGDFDEATQMVEENKEAFPDIEEMGYDLVPSFGYSKIVS